MQLKVGQKLVSAVDGTAVIVVRCPADEVEVTCGGHAMAPEASPPGAAMAGAPGDGVGAQLGKRYTVDGVGVELLCVKAGTHELAIDGVPAALSGARPLPASD